MHTNSINGDARQPGIRSCRHRHVSPHTLALLHRAQLGDRHAATDLYRTSHDASVANITAMADTIHAALNPDLDQEDLVTLPVTLPSPWTVAVADAANPANPCIAYVTNAHDRDDAIARVHAHHTSLYGWEAGRILTVAAEAGTPPADAGYGWTDLRGVKALRLVLEPAQVRQLARLRLRLRRWNSMMDPYYAAEAATGQEIPPSAWHAHSDEAEAICQALDPILFGQVSA